MNSPSARGGTHEGGFERPEVLREVLDAASLTDVVRARLFLQHGMRVVTVADERVDVGDA